LNEEREEEEEEVVQAKGLRKITPLHLIPKMHVSDT
jgi:hypothetical protein